MPKVKQFLSVQQKTEIVAKIRYGMQREEVLPDELALVARITVQTLYNRFKRPDEFRLGELRKICTKLSIPLEWLLNDKAAFKENAS